MRRMLAILGAWVAIVGADHASASIWPGSQEHILAGLASTQVTERRVAASHLLELPPGTIGEPLRTALRDEDVEVRLHAARAAIALRLERAGDEVSAWLQEPDPRLRAAACEVIQAAPSSVSVTALARALSDGVADVRLAAVRALGASGDSEALGPLLGRAEDPVPDVRGAVVRALGRLGDRRAAVPIVTRLRDAEVEVRVEAVQALGLLREPGTTAALERALQDSDLGVRIGAVQALGRIAAPSSATAIGALLHEAPSPFDEQATKGELRAAAMTALSRVGTPEAIRILVAQLEDEGPVPYGEDGSAPVREAIVALGTSAVPMLLSLLEASASPRQATAAARVLGIVPVGRDAGPIFQAIVRGARRGLVERIAALQALGRLREASALPFVLEHLEDSDFAVRAVAIETAGNLLDPSNPDGRAIDIVRHRITDARTPTHERVALAWLLGRTGSSRAAGVLASLFPPAGGPAPGGGLPASMAVAIAEACRDLGSVPEPIERRLVEQLQHPEARVRHAAARALARVASDATAKVLLTRLRVSAEEDRAALGTALSGVLARARDPELVGMAGAALDELGGAARDAILEGIGRSPQGNASAILARFARSTDVDDRRKVAEALAAGQAGESIVQPLLRDADAGVRANAVWSLGQQAGAGAESLARSALVDPDAAVAANAAVALARIAERNGGRDDAAAALCRALVDGRPYVQINALFGLRVLDRACEKGLVRSLLVTSRQPHVRAAAAATLAARLVSQREGSEGSSLDAEERAKDERALGRCGADDHEAAVASVCRGEGTRASHSATALFPVAVHVVPVNSNAPVPRAPFALVLADGALRLGVADRRGVVFEHAAPGGALELAVPAAWVR